MSDREKSKFTITAFSVILFYKIVKIYTIYIQSKEKYDVIGLNCHQTLPMACWPNEKKKYIYLFFRRLPLLPETNIGRNSSP